ncbi:hypothetical protein BC833DRAFT_616642 [Globomyces pollinis-pini]|nr:hypothetical protein BC833DRAFT_616642 [Globomyces pollinis-pini]
MLLQIHKILLLIIACRGVAVDTTDESHYVGYYSPPNRDSPGYFAAYQEDSDTRNSKSSITVDEFKTNKAEPVGDASPEFKNLVNQKNAQAAYGSDDEKNNSTVRIKIPFNEGSLYTTGGSIGIIVFGLFLLFAGDSAVYPILFAMGAFFFAIVSFEILNYMQLNGISKIPDSNLNLTFLAVMGVSGIIGGALAICLVGLVAYIAGAVLGFVGALFFLEIPFTAAVPPTGRIAIIVLFVVLGIIIGHQVKKVIFAIASSVLGSFLIFTGIDYFVQTGFFSTLRALGHLQHVPMTLNSYLMVGGFVLVAIIGAEHSVKKSSYQRLK